ncbi:MAG: glycoside hydrolase family 65 protein [Spirochaetales bacterium]|nr:glycoside hydrolase family 65 protein [Spirochaetales bacterium]
MYTLTDFRLQDGGTEKEDIIINGSRMMTGNGLLGCRGTMEEGEADAMPALIMNGLYDRQGTGWREPVNIPHPLSVRLLPDEGPVLGICGDPRLVTHSQELDFRYGILSRDTVWRLPGTDGEPFDVTVRSRRFVSMARRDSLFLEYRIQCTGEVNLTLLHGIQTAVYDIHGPHLTDPSCRFSEEGMKLECRTGEENRTIQVEQTCRRTGFPDSSGEREEENGQGFYRVISLETAAGREYTLELTGTVAVKDMTPVGTDLEKISFEGELERHKAVWDGIWDRGDVLIEGDEEAAAALRYSLYQLQIIAPRGLERNLSVPARGLSGQTYKGAVFWDTEMFISPYFLATDPDTARRFLMYRVESLEGAREKSAEYGYRGAFYAWESQERGADACSDYNVTDVFSGKPVRTFFRDKQIHISSAIVYALDRYLHMTGDLNILYEGALEMALECALFYYSRSLWSPLHKRYEFHDVLGPDEYHERVDNNAYTSRMALFTFQTALGLACLTDDNRYRALRTDTDYLSYSNSLIERKGYRKELKEIRDITREVYVPVPGEKNVVYRASPERSAMENSSRNIVEQFAGYFSLQDKFPAEIRESLLHPKEYWGGSSGPASGTRVIKQADVVLMLSLFPGEYSPEVLRANYDFYEPRTEHGSSLSACAHALLAVKTGRPDEALPYFKKTALVDIKGDSKHFAGLVYIGGTHPAASGGAWMTVVEGFCGLSINDGELTLNPRLPAGWTGVRFTVMFKDERYDIRVTPEGHEIQKRRETVKGEM